MTHQTYGGLTVPHASPFWQSLM